MEWKTLGWYVPGSFRQEFVNWKRPCSNLLTSKLGSIVSHIRLDIDYSFSISLQVVRKSEKRRPIVLAFPRSFVISFGRFAVPEKRWRPDLGLLSATRGREKKKERRRGRKGMSNHRQLFGIPEDLTTCTRLIDAPRPILGPVNKRRIAFSCGETSPKIPLPH